MKFLLIFLFSLTSASHSDYHKEKWSLFKENFGKEVPSEEDQFRMKVFFNNYLKIKEHNNKFQKNEVSFKLSMNHLGDMMTHEINSVMNGLKYKKRGKTLMFSPKNEAVPKSIDWREKGAVTPVKNQGHCGSCWAFSSTGALEGHHFIKKGGLVSLSEQNLVDCTRSEPYDNNGCNGGTMESAFEYVKDNHGIDTEESYPYKTKDGKCKFNPKNVGGTDSGYRSIPQGNEDALKAAVGTLGPVSVAIDASRPSFHFYSSGIYNEPLCLSDPEKLDHGVLVVGYGSENGTDFWIVKNSWGEKWGEKGYVRMLRNKNNQCGIASSASYPIV